jgi:outer membrane protein assembly factor BamB
VFWLSVVSSFVIVACAAGAESPMATLPAAPAVAGFLGDGSGWFRNCNPPTQWDEASGKGILWKTPLPNWGNSTPIAVNGRVFVTCEGGWQGVWPMLLCVDAATGKVLWQCELDHLDQLPDGREGRVREAWREYRLFVRDAIRCRYAYQHEGKKGEALKWWKEHGCQAGIESNEVLKAFGRGDKDERFAAIEQLLKQAGLGMEGYYPSGCTTVGRTFPTPVSDGMRVYVVTGFNAVFCFEMDGRLAWKKWFGLPARKKGTDEVNHTWFTHSPLLIGDRLITTVDLVGRCLDKNSGKTLWESHYVDLSDFPTRGLKHAHFVKYATGSPRHLVVDGTDVLIVSPGQVLRLADGKVLTPNASMPNLKYCGSTHDGRSVVYCYSWENNKGHYSDSPAYTKTIVIGNYALTAVGLSLDGLDAAKTKVVFDVPHQNSNTGGLVYRDGLLFGCLGDALKVWDARTGTEVKSVATGVGAPAHHVVAAGDYVYVLNKTGRCAVLKFDKTAAPAAVNTLIPAPHEGQKLEQQACQSGKKDWDYEPFTASLPFFEGSRMYIRSQDYLYCIGEK